MARKPVKNRGKTGEKRDPQGRFLSGTAAGPGRPANPYARHQAALKVAFAKAVSAEDVQAIAGKLVTLAKGGDVSAIKVILATVIGPVGSIDPDEIDRHEFDVRARQPTEIDELLLMAHGHEGDGGRSELATVEGDEDAAESEVTPEDVLPLLGWEQFTQGHLEWDPEAAAPIDTVFLAYARWCVTRDLPLLAEAEMCAWLRENGATLVTSAYTQTVEARGVRVVQ